MADYHPTNEQMDAMDAARRAVVRGKDNEGIKIIAFAGAGKTSTMCLIADDLCARGYKGIYLAFNKDIAAEARSKMPSGVEARTFHSLAYSQISNDIKKKLNNHRAFFPRNFEVDFKVFNFTITADTTKSKVKGSDNEKMLINNYRQYIVIKAAMDSFLLDMTQDPERKHIINTCESVLKAKIDSANKELLAGNLIGVLKSLWERFKDPNDDYQITPGVYLKLWALTKPQIDFDFILFDEAQDSDKLMLDILSRQKAKVIYVGDPHQQIYEWRGAVNAMSSINYPAYYLTQSFRFGKDIADYSGHILSYLGEKNKMLGTNKPCQVDTQNTMPDDVDAILCRSNIGVIESVLTYRAANGRKVAPCNIDTKQTIELINDIEKFKQNDSSLNHKAHPILSNFKDFNELSEFCLTSSFDTIIAPTFKLYREYGYKPILKLLNDAQKLDPNKDNVIISTTAHKAKGLEWDNVFLWEDFLLTLTNQKLSKKSNSNKPFVSDAEARLLYVTLTRAKKKLYAAHVDGVMLAIKESNKKGR